ncbi:MAG: hypothetical protein JST23_03780 [Bacteroidetes bacterium]|nr:hypothetical protein [Bacteroidota bacterium]
MRKKFLITTGIFSMIVLLFLACTRNNDYSQRNDVKNPKTGNEIVLADQGLMDDGGDGEIGDDGGGYPCSCSDHGGTVYAQITWYLATCRSGCTRGIGFRCGREGYLMCGDGSIIVCIRGANCPNQNRTIDSTRIMTAEYKIYDNKTLKFIFKKPIPKEEKDSPNGNVFEVESEEIVNFPKILKINGEKYIGVKMIPGNYLIDYSDGEFGSVVFNVDYVKK